MLKRRTSLLQSSVSGKTQLTWRRRFALPEHFKQVKSFVAEATGQNLDWLEAEVASISAKIRPGLAAKSDL